MKYTLIAVSAVLLSTEASTDANFDAWQRKYARTTTAASLPGRYANFLANSRNMAELQARSPLATYFADETADWSVDELRARTSGAVANVTSGMAVHKRFEPSEAARLLDNDIDWVSRGMVTRPESQGRCGTCLDFSGTASVESAWAVAGHPLQRLSVQQVVDCCGGGPGYCMQWVHSSGGLVLETDYPLANHSDPTIHGCRSACNTSATKHVAATITNVSCLPDHDEEQIRALLDHAPLSVSIAAKFLNGYHSGIINCTADGIDHAVLLVGYGVENGTAYWKLRNSWGPAFGEGGYFRFAYGNTCLRGPCQAHAPKAARALPAARPVVEQL